MNTGIVGAGAERHTHRDNAAIADMNAVTLPDLEHYHGRQLLPAVPAEVTTAITNHQRVVRQYRNALIEKAAAEAIVTGGQSRRSRIIIDAIDKGTDPATAETQLDAEIATARQTVETSRARLLGYLRGLNQATGTAMAAIEHWAPDALEHLGNPMDKAEAQVQKTRLAHEKAVAAYRELESIAKWLDGVHLEPGATWPNAWGMVMLNEDD